jgi:PAS domain S-box-containing protein
MAALERGVLERTQRLEESKIALEMSQARLSGIVESASDAIVTVDARQVIVQANSAAARMFCCPVAELVGGPIERFVPERFRQAHQRDIETFGTSPVSSRHMGHQRDVAALRADGQEFFSEASISHLMVNGQRLYTVILRDRTDRRAAEAELQTSQAKLEAALSSMNDAVAIFDAQGRCLEFNDAFTTFHRFSGPIECRAMLDDAPHLLDVSTDRGEPAAPQHQPVARALQGEAASNVEYHLRRTDTGEAWTGSYSYAPIRSLDDAIVGAVVTARDVTAQRKAQAELEASNATLQRLIAAQDKVEEEERKRIARELHDDLQQTLAGIRIDLGLIGERLTADPAGVRSLVSEADRLALAAVVSTRRIVNDLRPLILEELGLVPALEALTSRFAERSGIDCRLEVVGVADDALAHLPTVTSSLYRVTQEALNNVAKHAQATVVQIKFDRTANDLLTLRISDDGIGMSRREQRHAGSFGLLGMTERVRALGGQLRIDSDAGKGTTIEVLVPIPHQAAASGGAAGRAVDKTHPLAAALDPLGSTGELAGMKRESGHPLQNVIDALTGNVAVLDRSGTIQMVNRAWREFARRHGYSDRGGSGIGTSYLDVCRDSAKRDASLEPVLRGLQEVLGGSRDAFVTEYPCELPDGTNWFRMHAAPVTGGIVIVSHVNLSARLSSQPPSASDETFSPAASTSH